mgnify:CR=1 FL=1
MRYGIAYKLEYAFKHTHRRKANNCGCGKCTIGSSLGRYDSAMQCEMLDRCINELSAEQNALRKTLCANKRMYIGIGGSVGLIIAIVLI